jgi:hypothetical protein
MAARTRMIAKAIGIVMMATVWIATSNVQAQTAQYRVFAWNDLGMHCYDDDFSTFSLLPPFNTTYAQVVKVGTKPVLCTSKDVSVYYAGTKDPAGSINTYSTGKTNFWSYVKPLYGAQPPAETGLMGFRMPGKTNTAVPMVFNNTSKMAGAVGIPVTCIDDASKFNPYPMMQFRCVPAGKTTAVATIDAVVPVSSEMDCKQCHANGGMAAGPTQVGKYHLSLSSSTSPYTQSRENILRLHDAEYHTNLWNTKPVLCASCHYSKALDLGGTGPNANQTPHEYQSEAMHRRHGRTMDNQLPTSTNPAIVSSPGVDACYKCHPGNSTNCLRSVMAGAGIGCQNCHGDLLAVGGQYKRRQPWTDLPKCQSCHTGDNLSNLGGGLPRMTAFTPGDPTATPTSAPQSRFAENSGTLYRNSIGHGGLACSACHGSPHAEWPAANPAASDNVTATKLQGHAGPIVECSVCHGASQPANMKGPHGMHNVNSQTWVSQHHDLVEIYGMNSCKACHGTQLQGTWLSEAAANRSFKVEDRGTVNIAAGTAVSCGLCHKNPINGH